MSGPEDCFNPAVNGPIEDDPWLDEDSYKCYLDEQIDDGEDDDGSDD